MALNLMGGACINEDVLAYGYSFSSSLGYSIYNIGRFSTVILAKYTDGSYLAHVDVAGNQIGPVYRNGQFQWLHLEPMVAKAKSLTETSNYKILADCVPFYHQSIMGDPGYFPAVHFENEDGYCQAGRIYDQNGTFGGWPMDSLQTGSYEFGFLSNFGNNDMTRQGSERSLPVFILNKGGIL